MSKLKLGFSPTLYLLKALNTTIKSSIPKIDSYFDSDSVDICKKKRQKNIHICVSTKDNVVMLAVCNTQEGCARTTVIHTCHQYVAHKVAQEILEVLKRSSLNTEIEIGVSGECKKILQNSLVKNSDYLPSSQNLSSQKANKEEETMVKKITREDLTPRELEVFDILVALANGEEGTRWLIEDYNAKLNNALPKDFPKGVSSYITKLKRKGLIKEAGRGNIKVLCLCPPEKTSSNKASITKDIEADSQISSSLIDSEIAAKREELIGYSQRGPDPSTSRHFIDLLSRIKDPEKLAISLLENLSVDKLHALHIMFRLIEIIQNDYRCPKFEKTANGTEATMIID